MILKSQPARAESVDGQDETYYTDLLKMKLNNTVWVTYCSFYFYILLFYVRCTNHTKSISLYVKIYLAMKNNSDSDSELTPHISEWWLE